MWSWIIGFIVIVGIIVVVMNRRGSTGARRARRPVRRTGNDRTSIRRGFHAPAQAATPAAAASEPSKVARTVAAGQRLDAGNLGGLAEQ